MKPLAGGDGERNTIVVASVPTQSVGRGTPVAFVLRWSDVGDTLSGCRGRIV